MSITTWFRQKLFIQTPKDLNVDVPNKVISPICFCSSQALFGRLQQVASVAGDVLLGKDKIQKVLLSRLTETVIMWLSNEQEFWDIFEDRSVQLQPSGLQQVCIIEFSCYFDANAEVINHNQSCLWMVSLFLNAPCSLFLICTSLLRLLSVEGFHIGQFSSLYPQS